ncbi:MAG: hypothetical protein U0414_28610 [Polyangiaceae bacterium]
MERIDRYDVLALVREDGPLAVYLARDTTFGCDVSLETAPVDATETVAGLRAEARAKRARSDDVDVRVFEDLDRGLFCVATRKHARIPRPNARESEPTFHTMPRVVPFLLVGAAIVACGVAVAAAVLVRAPHLDAAPSARTPSVASVSSEEVSIAWEGCPPTTITLADGCIDAAPMLLTDCGSDCEAAAAECPRSASGVIRACASRADAERACARQGGALPSEDQWLKGKHAGMTIEREAFEWAAPAAGDTTTRGFRCFHPSDTQP